MDIGQKLLKILLERGEITPETAEELKHESINSQTSILDLLRKKKVISEEKIFAALAYAYNVPVAELANRSISLEIVSLIPEPVARKYKIIPFDIDRKNGKLCVATTDPMNLPMVEFLEAKSGKSLALFLAPEEEIIAKIDEVYAQGLEVEVTEAIKETSPVKTIEVEKIGLIIKEAPIAKIVATILEYAIKSRASDIHFEPQEVRTRVRYRIDGILHEKLALPRSVHEAVVSRIKILCNMKIDEKRLPQDGRFNFRMQDEEVDLRVSTLPTVYGEKVMMRLLRKTGGIPDLPELGISGPALKNVENAILKPHGIFLVTGPTGSGKTTTLYSILCRLNTTKVNIITLEDPVEYEIAGINQVQVNSQIGLTFASGMRAFLRQDPNIILVGEIRDAETTGLAVQAALTGHLVLATLHTNNAATAIPRLLDLGAEPFLLTSILNAVEAQRIVRKICVHCRKSFTPSPAAQEDVKSVLGNLYHPKPEGLLFYKGEGCKECANSGYLGRIGIFESIIITPTVAKLILERASASAIEKMAVNEGLITLRQDGYLKALSGVTTIEEVFRVAQE